MQFSGLDHVGFSVSDLDRSVEWYTEFLGEEPSLRKVWDVDYISGIVGYPNTKMDCALWKLPGGALLELIEYLEPSPAVVDMETYNAGNAHLCLQVDDLDAEFERLRGRVAFLAPRQSRSPGVHTKVGRSATCATRMRSPSSSCRCLRVAYRCDRRGRRQDWRLVRIDVSPEVDSMVLDVVGVEHPAQPGRVREGQLPVGQLGAVADEVPPDRIPVGWNTST